MLDLIHEKKLWKNGFNVIGVDEVGRGCLAGPIYVGAISFLHPYNTTSYLKKTQKWGIYDSKRILASKREKIYQLAIVCDIPYAVSSASVEEISTEGIVGAYQLAAKRAVIKIIKRYQIKTPYILSDGFRIYNLSSIPVSHQQAIPKGDTISRSIALASILAKVERDKYMSRLSVKYPGYFWEKNKGYGTFQHRKAILNLGPTKLHRRSFIKSLVS